MIDLEKMAESHKQLFPHATLESQEEKLKEEAREVLQELADCFVVCVGVGRFDQEKAEVAMGVIEHCCVALGFGVADLVQEVNRKWKINLKRKWEWNGKTYHHVGEDK